MDYPFVGMPSSNGPAEIGVPRRRSLLAVASSRRSGHDRTSGLGAWKRRWLRQPRRHCSGAGERRPASRKLYLDTLGLSLSGDEYLRNEQLAGCRSFGIWPLSQAAEACFGAPEWPVERPVPQVSIEFDVANADAVDQTAGALRRAGHELLHSAREEPWGQTVARLQSPEGAIIGISHIPMFHDPD